MRHAADHDPCPEARDSTAAAVEGTLAAVARAAAALGDPGRLRLVCYIANGERCVCDLVDLLDLAPATVSRHLSLLRDAGILERTKKGKFHHYRPAGGGAAVAAALCVVRAAQGDPLIRGDRHRVPKRLQNGNGNADGACCGSRAENPEAAG